MKNRYLLNNHDLYIKYFLTIPEPKPMPKKRQLAVATPQPVLHVNLSVVHNPHESHQNIPGVVKRVKSIQTNQIRGLGTLAKLLKEPAIPKLIPCVMRALSSSKKCRQFMGIPLDVFRFMMLGMEEEQRFLASDKFSHEDQLALFYCKVYQNLHNTTLGVYFDADPVTIGKVFQKMCFELFEFTRQFTWWLTKVSKTCEI